MQSLLMQPESSHMNHVQNLVCEPICSISVCHQIRYTSLECMTAESSLTWASRKLRLRTALCPCWQLGCAAYVHAVLNHDDNEAVVSMYVQAIIFLVLS